MQPIIFFKKVNSMATITFNEVLWYKAGMFS